MTILRSRPWLTVVASIVVLTLTAWWWWRNSQPAVAAPAMFARMAAAMHEGDPGAFLAEVHPDYDFEGKWPGLFQEYRTLDAGAEGQKPRAQARRALGQLFYFHNQNRLVMTVNVQRISERADGRVDVTVNMTVGDSDGRSLVGDALTGHRFTLARHGWRGRLAIIDHEPFTIQPF